MYVLSPTKQYVLGKKIGEGRYGEAFVAHSCDFTIDFCIKRMTKNNGDPGVRDVYNRESENLKKISHDNIVKIYEYFEDSDYYYLVFELCKNGTLESILKNENIGYNDIVAIFKAILSAISHSHHQNVVHRDLKLANIALDEAYSPKVIDWGYSQYLDAKNERKSFCGSFPYFAPEIFRKQQHDPKKADIWSIGVCLYFCIFKTSPWGNGLQSDQLDNLSKANIQFPSTATYEQREFLTKMMNINPANRPTADELLRHDLFQRIKISRSSTDQIKGIRRMSATGQRLIKPTGLNRTIPLTTQRGNMLRP